MGNENSRHYKIFGCSGSDLSEIVQQSSDTCKNLAINTQCSLQGNDVDTQRNSVLVEVEQEMSWMSSIFQM